MDTVNNAYFFSIVVLHSCVYSATILSINIVAHDLGHNGNFSVYSKFPFANFISEKTKACEILLDDEDSWWNMLQTPTQGHAVLSVNSTEILIRGPRSVTGAASVIGMLLVFLRMGASTPTWLFQVSPYLEI